MIHRSGNRLYRGWCGAYPRTIVVAVGVGPLTSIARAVIDKEPPIDVDAVRWLANKLANGIVGGPPRVILGNLLDLLGDRVPTTFDVADHVMWDDPVLTPQLCRRFDSTSRDPCVAIDYAYGVDRVQHVADGAIAKAWTRGYNRQPFVAVLDEQGDDAEPSVGSIRICGRDGDIADIVRQRVERDSEILVSDLRAVQVVQLPEPDEHDMQRVLEEAEQCLVRAAVADPEPIE